MQNKVIPVRYQYSGTRALGWAAHAQEGYWMAGAAAGSPEGLRRKHSPGLLLQVSLGASWTGPGAEMAWRLCAASWAGRKATSGPATICPRAGPISGRKTFCSFLP